MDLMEVFECFGVWSVEKCWVFVEKKKRGRE